MLEKKIKNLKDSIRSMQKVIVAFSGGIDSTLLARIVYDEMGENMLAITAVSPSIPQSELDECKRIAGEIGFPHLFIDSHEMDDENYTKNSSLRCYFCKKESFGLFTDYAKKEGYLFVLDGNNADDRGDYRPGATAAGELGVVSPLQEADLTKDDIRQLAKQLGLRIWDKPAAACLSSRIPYGAKISLEKLEQIEKGEAFLKSFNIKQLRVRHHETIARIEVPEKDFALILQNYEAIVAFFNKIGFLFVTLDLGGFHSGNLNKLLEKKV